MEILIIQIINFQFASCVKYTGKLK